MSKEPNAFVQYKGTDICLDFTCTCGEVGHFDGYFAYVLKCRCGLMWQMPSNIIPETFTGEKHNGIVDIVYDSKLI